MVVAIVVNVRIMISIQAIVISINQTLRRFEFSRSRNVVE